ncbi:hypothetical protein H0H93_016397 [Arthromyces matolae]|nr:hypothetical protein H0H93_016397 [Arthromyces matolae]
MTLLRFTLRPPFVRGPVARLPTRRLISTSTPRVVDLDFATQVPPNGNTKDGALVILHGLLGSKRNFTSLAKMFMKNLNIPVYSLDLRNHGTSPHVEPMTYPAMANDVIHFLRTHSLSNITLLGHSMYVPVLNMLLVVFNEYTRGGKVAMSVALHPSQSEEQTLSRLIVADVAPTRAVLSSEFKTYLDGMKRVEALELRTRKEAMAALEDYAPDPMLRQFLLTNLNPLTQSEPYAKFRVPLDTLSAAIPEIGWFPYAPGERSWTRPTLFIKGSQSSYINKHSLEPMESFFPNLELETLDAGHWVHGDRPLEFKKLVEDFIQKHS